MSVRPPGLSWHPPLALSRGLALHVKQQFTDLNSAVCAKRSAPMSPLGVIRVGFAMPAVAIIPARLPKSEIGAPMMVRAQAARDAKASKFIDGDYRVSRSAVQFIEFVAIPNFARLTEQLAAAGGGEPAIRSRTARRSNCSTCSRLKLLNVSFV